MEHVTELACTKCSVNGVPTLPRCPLSSTCERAPGRSVLPLFLRLPASRGQSPRAKWEESGFGILSPAQAGQAGIMTSVPQTGKLRLAEGPGLCPGPAGLAEWQSWEEAPGSCPERQARPEGPSPVIHPHTHGLREGWFRACALGRDEAT